MVLQFTIAFLENENQYRTVATLNRTVKGWRVKKKHPSFRLTPLCYYVHSTYSPYCRITASDIIYKRFVRPHEMFFDVVF